MDQTKAYDDFGEDTYISVAWGQDLDTGRYQIPPPLSVDQQLSGAVVASSQRALTLSNISYSLVGQSHLASIQNNQNNLKKHGMKLGMKNAKCNFSNNQVKMAALPMDCSEIHR